MAKPFRIAVIGAGVLGTSIVCTLKKHFQDTTKVILIEKHSQAGQETSRFNSGVLHSGIHSKPGSFKAQFARKGNIMAKQFCQENDVPINNCGMLIVATYSDLPYLLKRARSFWQIYDNGRDQDIQMQILMPWNIPKIEPNIRGMGALFIPDVAVIDQVRFTQSLFEKARQLGVETVLNNEVINITSLDKFYYIETEQNIFKVEAVINAAGLYADQIAKMAGFSQYKIYPYRGEYYEVLGKEAELVNRLVYPAPIEGNPGKGIHFVKTPDKRLLIGPNARLVPDKEYYEEDKTPESVFRNAATRFCPALRNAELKWVYSGIRPKLSSTDSIHHDPDFVFSVDNQNPFLLNIVGYESPGLSGAMAAAEYVKNLINDYIQNT